MKEEQRYILSQRHDISSLADIRAFAREALLNEGVDIDTVNISEEGITIHSFKNLVKALYDLGFKEGLEQHATIRGKKKVLEREGKILNHHQQKARYMAEKSQINVI